MIELPTDRLLEEWGNRLLRGRRHFVSDGLPIGGRLGAGTVRREVRAIVRRAPQGESEQLKRGRRIRSTL